MTDRELMQQCYAVPLHEQLTSVPENSRLVIDDPDGKGALFIPVGRMCHEAAAALRERLAQPEPPVLTGIDCSCGKKWRILNNTLTASEPETVMAEYKHQTYAAYKTDGEMKIGVVPEQEPVCAHDIPKTKCSFCRVEYKQPDHDWEAEYTKQVELHNQTLDELRDALAQPEQEPVAWRNKETGEFCTGGFLRKDWARWTPLYTTPPRREWVGLTADEIWKCNAAPKGSAVEYHICMAHQNVLDFAEAIEAKLKEKNT